MGDSSSHFDRGSDEEDGDHPSPHSEPFPSQPVSDDLPSSPSVEMRAYGDLVKRMALIGRNEGLWGTSEKESSRTQ